MFLFYEIVIFSAVSTFKGNDSNNNESEIIVLKETSEKKYGKNDAPAFLH